jgi:hypothetical protein
MPTSQNLRFIATVPKDVEFEHPPGAFLMRHLSRELVAAGWSTDEMDNWRDCGWSIACRKDSADLEVVLSWVDRGYWMLQVSPRQVPGLIARSLGAKRSAAPADVHGLALAVHRALSTLQYLGSPQWRWDGFPDEKHSTPEPQPA